MPFFFTSRYISWLWALTEKQTASLCVFVFVTVKLCLTVSIFDISDVSVAYLRHFLSVCEQNVSCFFMSLEHYVLKILSTHSVLLPLGIQYNACSFRQNDSEHDARRISSGKKRNLVMLEPWLYG